MHRNPASGFILFLGISSVLSAAPRLGLSSNTIGPVNIPSGANGTTQVVQAFNLGDGALNLSAVSSASWLSATVGAPVSCSQPGGTCYPINIALNTASAPSGRLTEYITVSDPNAIDSPQDITVTVNTAAVPASITAYVAPFGAVNSNSTIPLYTTGTGIRGTATTQSGGNWLQFIDGRTLIANVAPYLIEVSALPGMAPGSYQGSVTISGSSVAAENRTIAVTLNVTSGPILYLSEIAPIRLVAAQNGAVQYSALTLSSIGPALTISSASSASKFLTATVSGASLLIAADPTGLAPGIYNGTVTLNSNAANNAQVAIPVEFQVAASAAPLINANGIVNIASYAQEPVAPGDIAAIYGVQLAPNGTNAVNTGTPPLATTLGGVQVLVNGVPAPLYYVSPGQINFQAPYSLTPGQTATVQVVSNSTKGNIRPLSVIAAAPRLLYFVSFIQGAYGIIVNASDGSLTLPSGTNVPGFSSHPAKPGDTLVVYGVGFGQTSPGAVEGVAASGTTLQSVNAVSATFGGGNIVLGQMANAGFAGLTPTAVGLYQVNVTVPASAPLGPSVPLYVVEGNNISNVVTLAISADGR